MVYQVDLRGVAFLDLDVYCHAVLNPKVRQAEINLIRVDDLY